VTREEDKAAFASWLHRNHPGLGVGAVESLERYGNLLAEEARRINLVSRGDRCRVRMRHVRECLSAPLLERLPKGANILDVGSGGGLPGIPIALSRPDVNVLLVEPREKRAAFLERLRLLLPLPSVGVSGQTLEGTARQREGEHFDVAVSRAIAWTPGMVTAAKALLPDDGKILRLGSPKFHLSGVEVVDLEIGTQRAVQSWPRDRWEALPGAR